MLDYKYLDANFSQIRKLYKPQNFYKFLNELLTINLSNENNSKSPQEHLSYLYFLQARAERDIDLMTNSEMEEVLETMSKAEKVFNSFYETIKRERKSPSYSDVSFFNVYGNRFFYIEDDGNIYDGHSVFSDSVKIKKGFFDDLYDWLVNTEYMWDQHDEYFDKQKNNRKRTHNTYNTTLDDEQIRKLFNKLKDLKIETIATDTEEEDFVFVFSNKPIEELPHKLEWIGPVTLLSYLIDYLQSNNYLATSKNKWKIAEICFNNIKSSDLLKARYNYKNYTSCNKPKGWTDIDSLFPL